MQAIQDQIEARRADLRAAQNKLDSLHGRSRAVLAKAEGRELNAAEAKQIETLAAAFDAAEVDVVDINAQISALESTPMGRQTHPRQVVNASTSMERHASRAAAPASNFASLFRNERAADSYGGQFASFGQFALAVAAGGNDSRLIRNSATTSTAGEGASAGFLIPMQWVSQMMDEALAREVVRPRANVVPIQVGVASVVGFDSTDGTSSKRAGLTLDWGPGDGEALLAQKPKAREVNFSAKKASVFCRVSTELADDAPGFDVMLRQAMVSAVAAGLDAAFINGIGGGQPLGVLNCPALITVAKESGQAASTIFLQNLAKMVGRLSPSSFTRAVWLVHPTAVPQLYLMSYTVKNVAGTENVGGTSAQAIGVGADGQLRIFGLPCVVTDACAALTSAGDVMLADFSRYIVAMRSDVRLVRDVSRYFDTDEIAFRLTMRLDGMPEDSTATKLRDGTNTVSPFVALGAR